ncbi:MAG: Polymyxin resistance protein ArnT, undecaprenyl phosphate-alpha-L-Ara4N transferase [Parcubacteria group bacterium Athens1014_10]|nr:MAG: Polymyxin resistance protein ArnT, undecaprenyl phosphate-alpha-L-Ara4N transferase [Parcubacteria group bacterium Athens1014_10]TSD04470.1 MAG: Polymyxin resistance protein ArnT, undecaprenyl phosphate-alpha-L-Ara4N transferase [Parcubacteria group bacterium Athens0714_12]
MTRKLKRESLEIIIKQFKMEYFKKYRLEIILFLIAVSAHFFFFFLLLRNYGFDSFYITNFDAYEFFKLGRNLFQYQIFSNELAPPFYLNSFRTIFYPLYLAFFQFFTNQAWLAIAFQNIIASFSIVLVYRIGRLIINNNKISFLAALIFALDPLQNYWSNLTEPDTLLVFLLLVVNFYFIKYWQGGSRKNLYLTALFLGLAALTKPVALYYPIFFCAFIFIGKLSKKEWQSALKPIIVFVFIFFLTISPWLFRNWYHFKVIGISSITGENLFRYAGEVGHYPEEISDYVKNAPYHYKIRDIRAQSTIAALAIKRIFEHPLIFARSQILGMIKFFIDDGHKEAYYNQHYKAMFFYDTPEPENKPDITQGILKGDFSVIPEAFKNLNRYMVIYFFSKIIYILFYIIAAFGLAKAYKSDKKLFAIFLLFVVLFLYIAAAAGPWGASVRYRLPVLPGMLLIFFYGFFHRVK